MTEETLADVDHTHPHTGETFGGVYRRGPAVADGAGPGVGVDEGDAERLGGIDHASGSPTPDELWKRGPGDVSDGSGGGDGDEADR